MSTPCACTARRRAPAATPTSPTRSRWPASSPNTGWTPRPSSRPCCTTSSRTPPATREEIAELFGEEIAELVEGVTKLSKLELPSEHTRQAENLRKFILAISKDVRVLLVKLADRLHNMRTLHFIKSPAKRERIARETLRHLRAAGPLHRLSPHLLGAGGAVLRAT